MSKYYEDIKKDRDKDRPREFTYMKKVQILDWCPWRASRIFEDFDWVNKELWDNNDCFISVKDKWRFDITTNWIPDYICDVLYELERRTCDHCYKCWKPGDSRRPYWDAVCDDCFNILIDRNG